MVYKLHLGHNVYIMYVRRMALSLSRLHIFFFPLTHLRLVGFWGTNFLEVSIGRDFGALKGQRSEQSSSEWGGASEELLYVHP